MKTILFTTLLSVILASNLNGQVKIHRKCGPADYLKSRTFIQNDSLNQKPFDAIVHINMRGWGTATFINDSTLITANHIAGKKNLRRISIYKNVYRNNKVENDYVELTNKDFKVKNVPYDNCHFISSDISYIILSASGKEKVKNIYTNYMEIADYKKLNLDKQNIFLTGYPVDLAGRGINRTDILSNKKTAFKELRFDAKCDMVGYKIFTCSGDSGAPLWVEADGKFYLIGIHHGGPERGTIFNQEKRNTAALIRDEVLIYNNK